MKTENINNLFIEGLVENNTEKLLLLPKSDLHNHSTKGCRREWIEEKIGRSITKQPEKLCCNLILFEIYWNGIDMAFQRASQQCGALFWC